MLMRMSMFLLTAPFLPGCTSIVHEIVHKPANNKQLPKYPKAHEDPTVAVVSIDASRRVVLSQIRVNVPGPHSDPNDPKAYSTIANPIVSGASGNLIQRRSHRFTCSEPPPDVAMNSFAQDLISLSSKAGSSAEASAAIQKIAQVIGARSPHVEMWRTTSWTYCNLLMNEAYAEAAAYLKAGELALAVPVHNASKPDPASGFANLPNAVDEHSKKQAEENMALKSSNAKLELQVAKFKCEKITAEKVAKPDITDPDRSCEKVKEAESVTKKAT